MNINYVLVRAKRKMFILLMLL